MRKREVHTCLRGTRPDQNLIFQERKAQLQRVALFGAYVDGCPVKDG